MPPELPKVEAPGIPQGKAIPPTADLRDRLRATAAADLEGADRARLPTREEIEAGARQLLAGTALPQTYLGFAMVAWSNAFWRPAFAAIPYSRRLLLLPHCLRNTKECPGTYNSLGLHCAGCGACPIGPLKARAETLGYRVLVAEGTSAVTGEILSEDLDAVLGVACLDSLEKSFTRVREFGCPALAVPLLRNGCADTRVEIPVIEELLTERGGDKIPPPTYLPIFREARRLFQPDPLREHLSPYVNATAFAPAGDGTGVDTERLAIDWLGTGGKRLRPFVTLAAYAVGHHGTGILRPAADLRGLIPPSVQRLALAIEALHKASLLHDDIEDASPFRYGRPTMHRVYGIPAALNVGDYLVGLGYRLVTGERASLGEAAVADILTSLTSAHLKLCRGQGAEILGGRGPLPCGPSEVLAIQALKTAPAFEAALYAGLRAADMLPPEDLLRRLSTFVGEGYQIQNDLDDWAVDGRNKVETGGDTSTGRPTILRAFALEGGGTEALRAADAAPEGTVRRELTRRVYEETGAFTKAHELVDRLRERALNVAEQVPHPPLRELFTFLVRLILGHGG